MISIDHCSTTQLNCLLRSASRLVCRQEGARSLELPAAAKEPPGPAKVIAASLTMEKWKPFWLANKPSRRSLLYSQQDAMCGMRDAARTTCQVGFKSRSGRLAVFRILQLFRHRN